MFHFSAIVLQACLLFLLAPLVSGVIKKVKANLQGRTGPGVFQPYYDLVKYLQKDTVVSEHASWIFAVTPYVAFGSVAAAALFVPGIAPDWTLHRAGDVFVVIYLFALARFFTALASLDTGSAFGGMGGSREMSLGAVIEPAMLLALFAVILQVGSTSMKTMAEAAQTGFLFLTPAHLLAGVAFAIALLAETGRIPFDNPDTHLELTMIHEGMLLEYSGKDLALLMWAASARQLLLFSLIANIFLPWGVPVTGAASLLMATAVYLLKIGCIAVVVALVETSTCKMRLFRAPELLGVSVLLSLLALIAF